MLGLKDFRPSLKRRALEGAWSLMNTLSIDRAFVRRRSVRGATILMYHAITDARNRAWIDPRFSIEADEFERHIRFLARYRRPVSLTRLVEMIEAGITPDAGTVVVTFDDGYLDTLRVAGPILKRAAVPATVFVVSGWAGSRAAPWTDQLFAAFNHRRSDRLMVQGRGFDLSTHGGEIEAFSALSGILLAAGGAERDRLLEEILTGLTPGIDFPRQLMTWDEIGAWQALGEGYEVGLHTRTHTALTLLGDPGAVRRELDHGIGELSRRFGIDRPHFSYPYGRANAAARQAVRAAGCRAALVTEPMQHITAGSDLFALSRQSAPRGTRRLGFLTSGAYPELSQKIFRRQ